MTPRISARGCLRTGMVAALLWSAVGLHGQSSRGDLASGAADALVPDTVLTPPSGPRIVHLAAPGSPVVSLRLSIPLRETAAEAGAGRILQMLGTERAADLARPMGARVEGSRTPWGIAYTVTGALADVDFLAYLLRQATRDPAGRGADFRGAVATLRQEADHRLETPGGRIATRLRADAAPETPPPGGTRGSLARLTLGDVRAVWTRTHRTPRMTLVVAGDVPLEVALASARRLGTPLDAGGPAPLDVPVSEPDPPPLQVLRHWYGEAWPVAADPHAEVAALLVAEHLQDHRGDFEVGVQLRQLPERRVLTLVGAAYYQGRAAMQSTVRSVLSETTGTLTSAAVERAVSRLRADLLMAARDPAGRAGRVGLDLDAEGGVTAARDRLEALAAITADSTRDFLTDLAQASPLTAEIRP